jgi:hypothetical protein
VVGVAHGGHSGRSAQYAHPRDAQRPLHLLILPNQLLETDLHFVDGLAQLINSLDLLQQAVDRHLG